MITSSVITTDNAKDILTSLKNFRKLIKFKAKVSCSEILNHFTKIEDLKPSSRSRLSMMMKPLFWGTSKEQEGAKEWLEL